MSISSLFPPPIGWWDNQNQPPETGTDAIRYAFQQVTEPLYFLNVNGSIGVGRGGRAVLGDLQADPSGAVTTGYPLLAYIPPLPPESLGDPYFKATNGVRYPYIIGAMANGITSVKMVESAARSGMLSFFGAAGLALEDIENNILLAGAGDIVEPHVLRNFNQFFNRFGFQVG